MKILLISHSTGIKGPIDFFEDYLIRNDENKNADKVYKLEHPLNKYNTRNSCFYENKINKERWTRKGSPIANLFIDLFISLKIIHKVHPDIIIGANNFDTLAAILSKYFFRYNYRKIIYFASDFSGNRFRNILLNEIYFIVEKIVLKKSDLIISNTKRAEKKRLLLGLNKNKSLVIPNGIYIDKPDFSDKKINKKNFIYIGHVSKEHGIVNLISVIYPLIEKITVIGQGDEWKELVKILRVNNIKHELYLRKKHSFVINKLKEFHGFGLAPYTDFSEWTYYCSPLKVNEYVACGVPVIMSNVPEVAQKIERDKLGVVYGDLTYKEIKEKIERFSPKDFNIKARKFYNNYNYQVLYKKINL